jgi:hypothetical protein
VTPPVWHGCVLQMKTISLADFKGKYLVLFFYPLDWVSSVGPLRSCLSNEQCCQCIVGLGLGKDCWIRSLKTPLPSSAHDLTCAPSPDDPCGLCATANVPFLTAQSESACWDCWFVRLLEYVDSGFLNRGGLQ